MAHTLPMDLMVNGTGILSGLARWAYTVTLGWFWAMILLGFCVVLMIATTRFGTPRSFGFASFVGMMGAIFLSVAQLMSWGVASLFIVVGFIGFVVLILNER